MMLQSSPAADRNKAPILEVLRRVLPPSGLVLEIASPQRSFTIVTNFDCGHTHPMLTIAQMTGITLIVGQGLDSRIIIEEPMVTRA